MEKFTPPGKMVEPFKRKKPRLILNCLYVSVGSTSKGMFTPRHIIKIPESIFLWHLQLSVQA